MSDNDGLFCGMECIVKITVAATVSSEDDMKIVVNSLNRIHFPEEVIIAKVLYPPAYQEPLLIHRHRDKVRLHFNVFAEGPPIEEWIEEWRRKREEE